MRPISINYRHHSSTYVVFPPSKKTHQWIQPIRQTAYYRPTRFIQYTLTWGGLETGSSEPTHCIWVVVGQISC